MTDGIWYRRVRFRRGPTLGALAAAASLVAAAPRTPAAAQQGQGA